MTTTMTTADSLALTVFEAVQEEGHDAALTDALAELVRNAALALPGEQLRAFDAMLAADAGHLIAACSGEARVAA